MLLVAMVGGRQGCSLLVVLVVSHFVSGWLGRVCVCGRKDKSTHGSTSSIYLVYLRIYNMYKRGVTFP